MKRLALFLLGGLAGTTAAIAVEPATAEQHFPERPQLQVLRTAPDNGMVLLEASTIDRIGDQGFVWRVDVGPRRNGPLRAVRLVVDCPSATIRESRVTHISPAPDLVVTGHEEGSAQVIADTQLERHLVDAACSGRPLDFAKTFNGFSLVLAYGLEPAWPNLDADRSDKLRQPPADPEFIDWRQGERGSMVFLETTTMGRVGNVGYAWQLEVEPQDRSKGPAWTRLILDCRNGTIIEDWVVSLDRSFAVVGTESAFSSVTATTPEEHRLRDLACGPAGRPLPVTYPGIARAVIYAQALSIGQGIIQGK